MRGQQKSDQPKPVALTCFGGPSGGRTLDLGIKSLERDVMECLVAAKSQVVMFPHALTALKLHCRTDIDGYPAMHKAPPRQFHAGEGLHLSISKVFLAADAHDCPSEKTGQQSCSSADNKTDIK